MAWVAPVAMAAASVIGGALSAKGSKEQASAIRGAAAADPMSLELGREQAATLRQQRSLLDQQNQLQNILLPGLLESAGFKAVTAPGQQRMKELVQVDSGGNFAPNAALYASDDKYRAAFDQAMAEHKQAFGVLPSTQRNSSIEGFSQQIAQQLGPSAFETGPPQIVGAEKLPVVQQIEEEFRGRTLRALKGDLPPSPNVQRDIAAGELRLRDTLRKQLGPGYESSTPGIEAMSRFEESANIAKQNDINAQLSLSAGGAINAPAATIAATTGATAPTLSSILPLSALASGLGGSASLFSSQTGNQLSAALGIGQLQQRSSAGIGSLLGTLFSAPQGSSLGGGGLFGGSTAGAAQVPAAQPYNVGQV